MTVPVKICKQRFESETYWTPNKELGKPLIINVRDACIDSLRKTRENSDNDVEMLKKTLPKLGFGEPCVMDKGYLNDKEKFFNELERIAEDVSMTKEADVFLCVIMAFGENGYIFLNNEESGRGNVKVDVSDIIKIFKADHCHRLICKPKIFIVHTDYHDLRPKKKNLFGDTEDITAAVKIPMEADIMVYHSQLTAAYTKHIDTENYKKLVEKDLVLGFKNQPGNDGGDVKGEEKPGTHFIFTLCKAAESLYEDRKFDLFRLIFLTNKKLKEFLDLGYWRPLPKSWSRDPKIPTCTFQLTKNIIFDLEDK